jgi:peroxiredoxin
MTLQSELDTFKSAWLERVGPDTAKLVDDDNVALQSLAAKALKAGDRFPAVVLTDQLGRKADLGVLASDQPLIVTFYRGGWCPYCNLELRAYQKALPEIEALGARLVAITPEAPDNTLSTAEKNDLSFSSVTTFPPETTMTAGHYRCLQPSLSKKVAAFALPSSIRITASGSIQARRSTCCVSSPTDLRLEMKSP